jgi:hypothetical protein
MMGRSRMMLKEHEAKHGDRKRIKNLPEIRREQTTWETKSEDNIQKDVIEIGMDCVDLNKDVVQ